MSFSQEIKNEILDSKTRKKCCLASLRYGELSTESTNLIIPKAVITNIKQQLCCKKAFLKGAFLGNGCIVNPKNDYHFEISFKSKKLANISNDLLLSFDLKNKIIKRDVATYVIYIKDSEEISTVLRILEANKSLLKYENIRIEKSIRNNINRSVNCETSNIKKTIKNAFVQIEAINKIIENNLYDSLPIELKQICILRQKYSDASLDELAKKSNTNISKSGVNYRLQKILKIAGNIK